MVGKKKVLFAIPAYNEGEILEGNVIKVYNFLDKNMKKYDWRIIISNNASEDNTSEIAKKLSRRYKSVSYVDMDSRPKSKSIKRVWLSEDADIYAYMDADLSTDIKHIPQLIGEIERGYDISTGSRVSKESETSRSFKRHLISMILILMLKTVYSVGLSDFQCGFKAISRRVRDNIIPKMKAIEHGFMDTEMIVVAANRRYRIKEFPILWKDDRETKIDVVKGSIDALKNMAKIKLDLLRGRYM